MAALVIFKKYGDITTIHFLQLLDTIMDREKFDEALITYYNIAGWDQETGNPTEGTLKRLSLGWLLEE
jgi:aldehyde:ferredoxin oxidoreductase